MELSGTTLIVVGMSIVFLALALLALIAWILERVFRVEAEQVGEIEEATKSDVEAAIALTLAYHTKRKGSIHMHTVTESMWMQQTRVYQ